MYEDNEYEYLSFECENDDSRNYYKLKVHRLK